MESKRYKTNFRNFVMGVDAKIPLINGRFVTAINFDNAATTPPFLSTLQQINNFSPWYSSIHRGTGYKSQFSSNLYEKCRNTVGNFVGADMHTHTVIFVKNTTEAINKLSYRLCKTNKKCVVLSTCMEHHSNDLPWRDKYDVDYIAVDHLGKLSLEDLEYKLKKYKDHIALVTITGISNVTGYKNPIYKIARLVHKYHAKILVDGAQLIPHAPFHMNPIDSPEHIDYLAFSAHKMYAPFGIGVLIGPESTFEEDAPEYSGGGTVDMVTHDFIRWAQPPHKEESGTPNIIGVIALSSAIHTLKMIGMENIEKYENSLTTYALQKLKKISGIQLYGNPDDCTDRVSIIPFNIADIPHEMVATILSYEAGIAVRNGCFCAQPYIQELLNINSHEIEERIKDSTAHHPGMVRISFGLYNHYDEIDMFMTMLEKIITNKAYYLKKYSDIHINI
ncbi:aminotransferase class V-fold PLP-dependent enzyme [Marinisporobacter balticus]|uniref:Selenocysteine lyase/cysteine desulfurase n=1 Tax=Marinisporobacter balticus TaxID=2018667 RepID=A0A4R2KGT7_9FIRM|nr:aminotransferase class V-fold PLP-dependent enzyme [Marinisporobacter balticus]TCO69686.1 selenocysteine lyase/cysteine desulfurase [Marinisporobacter balticus]